MIRLNVGGRLFCTTSSTLLGGGEPNLKTYFHALLEGSLQSTRDETGAYFIDRSAKTFAVLLELLRTGVLTIDFDDETLVRAVLVEADFYLLSPLVHSACVPFAEGLYGGGARDATNAGSHPWVLMVEKRIDSRALHPCQVFLTGVVDDELLLREPARLRCGAFVVVSVHGKELALRRNGARGIECTLNGEQSHLLEKECDPSNVFSEALLPLKLKMRHGKGKENTTVRWFERDSETGEIVLWKQKPRDGRSVSAAIRVMCPQLILFGRGQEWEGLVFLSGRVPFVIKRRKSNAGPLVVIGLQRDQMPPPPPGAGGAPGGAPDGV